MKNIYCTDNSEYLKNNPTWDIEHTPWKANRILHILKKHNIHPQNIVEVGCGSGGILNHLRQNMPDGTIFSGYDIAPDAIKIAKEQYNGSGNINFYCADFLKQEQVGKSDLLLAVDVVEHVPDCFGFLDKLKDKATWKLFCFPLDLSVYTLFYNIHYRHRNSVGHIHYFSKETAILTVRDCGYEVIDYEYASMMIENNTARFATLRHFLHKINKDFFVRLLGGYGLWILAK